MTSAIDQPRTVTVEPGETTGHQNRALKVGLLVLAVIAVALGGILIYNAAAGDDDTAAAIPDEIQQVLDDYFAASTDKDFEALLAVTTDEFTRPMYQSSFELAARPAVFREVSTFDDLERNFASSGSYGITNVGDPLIHGDGPWFVSVAQIWETTTADGETGSGVGIQSIYTLVIVDDDGTLKVDDAYWAGHGLVPIED